MLGKTLLVIILITGFSTRILFSQDNLTKSVEVNLVSWNIQMLPNDYQIFSKSLQKKQRLREPEIANFCNSKDFDIIVFQEVFDVGIRRKLKHNLKSTYPYQIDTKTKLGRLTNNGIFIVSRVPIKLIDYTIYPKGTNEDRWAAKGCTLIEAIKDSIVFQVAGTHLQSGGSEDAQKHRLIQYSEIRTLIACNSHENIPVFVVGDMNTRKSDTTQYNNMLDIIGVVDFEIDDEEPYTIDGKNSWNSHEQGIQLDYILINKRKTESMILQQGILRPNFFIDGIKTDLSDHYGVFARVRISN